LSNARVEPTLAGGWGAVGARQIAPAKISENCYGTFPFLCYIPALSKGAKVFPMRLLRPEPSGKSESIEL